MKTKKPRELKPDDVVEMGASDVYYPLTVDKEISFDPQTGNVYVRTRELYWPLAIPVGAFVEVYEA